MVGHITYLSEQAMHNKFGRRLQSLERYGYEFQTEFAVESYLKYNGNNFTRRFDANSYLYVTKALDYFDPAADFNGDLTAALSNIRARCLVLAFSSDWRFSPARSREIVRSMISAGIDVAYAEVQEHHGHDAFLMPIPYYLDVFESYMKTIDTGDV